MRRLIRFIVHQKSNGTTLVGSYFKGLTTHLYTLLASVSLCLLLMPFCYANMASGISEGTSAGLGYASRDIDILSETIDITIEPDFLQAEYQVTYQIYSPKSGTQIPLIFEVLDNNSAFSIQVDDQKPVPVQILTSGDSRIDPQNFYYPTELIESTNTAYSDSPNPDDEPKFSFQGDVKYFKVDLSQGEHTITAHYHAYPTENLYDWTVRYYYQYSLKPAKSWKSFNDLTVNLKFKGEGTSLNADNVQVKSNLINTDVESPTAFTPPIQSHYQWHFDHIPTDVIEISYQVMPSPMVQWLIALDAHPWLSFVLSIIFFGSIHYYLMYLSRKQNRKKGLCRPNVVTWLGIIFVPLIALLVGVWRVDLIDWLLQEHASRYHGYILLTVVFGYPLLLPCYLVATLVVNSYLKRRFAREYQE